MLVVPEYPALEQWARRRGSRAASLVGDRRALIADADVQEVLRCEVDTNVAEFARVERPKRVAIVPDEFSVENTLLTPTLKVRRRVVEERYAALLAALYTS